MTQEEFSSKFKDLFSGMIQVAFEYVNRAEEVEQVYVYSDLEGNTTSFNCFFQIKGNLVKMHLVNDFLTNPVETSFNRMKEILRIGTEDGKEVRSLFENFQGEAPTNMKFIYSTKDGKFDSQISYDLQHTNTDDLLPSDIFKQWFDEVSESEQK